MFEQIQQQQWKPHDVITECLQLQTDAGDVQTAVCVLIALGDKRCDLPIDEVVCVSIEKYVIYFYYLFGFFFFVLVC